MPIHPHDGAERLEPKGMGETAQQLIAPVVMHHGLADHRAQAGHAIGEPFRDMPAMQWKVSRTGSSGHQALRAAAWITRQTRSGVAGMSIWRMPNSESASTSAFMTDGRAPAQPASPQPFAPSGFVVAGTQWKSCMNSGASSARGIA